MDIDKNEFFKEVTLRICGSLDIDLAIEDTFAYIRQFIPADTIGLGFSDVSAKKIRIVTKFAIDGVDYPWDDSQPDIQLSEDDLEFIRRGSEEVIPPMVINRVDLEVPQIRMLAGLFPNMAKDSVMFLALDIHGKEVGALLISASGHDRFIQNDADLIEAIREPLTIAIINARQYKELEQTKMRLAEDFRALSNDFQRNISLEVVGADFGLREVMEQVRKIAPSNSPTLILGETGTGKEVIANAIHMSSPRNNGPMISMQCGAIPETLLDSELFGHEKGAYTGASERKRGRFERAHGGTLFLDEVGELSPEAQVKLLRVLQEHCFERVGGTDTVEVDVRVVAATHRDLEKMVRDGKFREDLWYRLNVLPIRIPPLRLRRDDIPSLVQYFVKRKAMELNLMNTPWISNEDIDRLKAYDWPGNVREVQNIVERVLILSHGDHLIFPELESIQIQNDAVKVQSPPQSMLSMDEAMTQHICSVLEQIDWQVAGKGGAAEILKMDPGTLRFRMKKLGIKNKRARKTTVK